MFITSIKSILTPRNITLVIQRFKGGVVQYPRGPPRSLKPGEIAPTASKYKFKVEFPEEYTIEPLKLTKLGGRDPETGHVAVGTLGGGRKYKYRWVDHLRTAPPGEVLVEKVEFIREDPVRSAHIALVGGGIKRRWIVATASMKPGDLIETSTDIPKVAIQGKEGNAYPVGALAIGSVISQLEKYPGDGGRMCNAAGTSASIIRRLLNNQVVVVLPNKKEIILDPKCMAVVGQVSNVEHGSIPIGSPNMMRYLGHRSRSGHRHKKDGYCGRKIHPKKPPQEMKLPEPPEEILKLHMFPLDFKQKKQGPVNTMINKR